MNEVQAPILVPNRGLVTILYQRPRMTLTAKGRAMQDGADGEVPPCVTVLRTGPGLASNAHAGGSMGPYAAPDGLADEARRVFADSGLVYGTVDFLFADEPGSSFYVCETNACPGFEAFEACTGLDAAGAILGCVSYAGGTR